ncbi:hypothetical protein [Methylobacterium indicum]|uniref:Uncharacterized protein n=1 Tax=Methylobacterium indicum TaxID=1775910 RepID=A0A8H8X0Q1_9HYPH|nr:hypothetical protein [Methylobacterium indicum]BCM87742.1 hypothetical protein mvi_62030 [Methylobacterium indicum]
MLPSPSQRLWLWNGQDPGVANTPPVWPSLIWGKNWAFADDGRLTFHQADGPLTLEIGQSVVIAPDQTLTLHQP